MKVEVISYRIGVGSCFDVARHQLCLSHAEAIRQASNAQRRGEIWVAPITNYGVGRWKQIGWYDGCGGVFVGPDGDEPATPELFAQLTATFN